MPCIPTVLHDFEEAGHDSLSCHTGQHTKQLRKYLEQHCPTHTFPSMCLCAYVRVRCTLDHFEEWWHRYWRRRLLRVEEEGHHTQLSCTEETSAPANPQRTITQTAASAGGTLLTHRKLSWYYLCCLDPPQGFPLSSFIFPQCSFSLNLLSLLSTNCQRMNMFLKNVLVIL